MEIKSLLKNIGVVMVKNGCGHSGHRTLKLTVSQVSQEVINGINWSLVCSYKFRKAKSYFDKFWVVMVKNGHCLLGLGTQKCAVSQEWIDEMSYFLHADTN